MQGKDLRRASEYMTLPMRERAIADDELTIHIVISFLKQKGESISGCEEFLLKTNGKNPSSLCFLSLILVSLCLDRCYGYLHQRHLPSQYLLNVILPSQ